MSAAASIRVMTWNIHGAVGADRRCDPQRALALIARHRPDILALQEVDGRVRFRREARAFETFAAALGEHGVEARMIRKGDADHDYGHLLWSRWPFVGADVRRLPGGRVEPRGVIDAVSLTPLGPLRILAAHLGLMPADRRRQAAFIAGLTGEGAASPTIALGDFNDWRRRGAVQALLLPRLPVEVAPRTWPSRRPLVRMDRLYGSPDIEIVRAVTDRDARDASDHLPVIADIRLAVPASG